MITILNEINFQKDQQKAIMEKEVFDSSSLHDDELVGQECIFSCTYNDLKKISLHPNSRMILNMN